jgi:hypothetical protein
VVLPDVNPWAWLSPDEETSKDRAIREEGEWIRKAVKKTNFDHPSASKLKGPLMPI